MSVENPKPKVYIIISQWELKMCFKKKSTYQKRGKTWATKSWSVLALCLIGLEDSASFVDQSQTEWCKTKTILHYFRRSVQRKTDKYHNFPN